MSKGWSGVGVEIEISLKSHLSHWTGRHASQGSCAPRALQQQINLVVSLDLVVILEWRLGQDHGEGWVAGRSENGKAPLPA